MTPLCMNAHQHLLAVQYFCVQLLFLPANLSVCQHLCKIAQAWRCKSNLSCLEVQIVMLGSSNCHAWKSKLSCLEVQIVMHGSPTCHAWKSKLSCLEVQLVMHGSPTCHAWKSKLSCLEVQGVCSHCNVTASRTTGTAVLCTRLCS